MTVLWFEPGLTPVLKHGSHDQSTHGRRGGRTVSAADADRISRSRLGRGTSAIAVDEKRLKDAAEAAGRPFSTEGKYWIDDMLKERGLKHLSTPTAMTKLRESDPEAVALYDLQDRASDMGYAARRIAEQGFMEPSPVVSRDDFIALAQSGDYEVIFRGGPTGLADGMTSGQPWIGTGIGGPGSYFAPVPWPAVMYAQRSAREGGEPEVVVALLPKAAKRGRERFGPDAGVGHGVDTGADYILSRDINTSQMSRLVYNTGSLILVDGPRTLTDAVDVARAVGIDVGSAEKMLKAAEEQDADLWRVTRSGDLVHVWPTDVAKHGSPGRPGYAALHPSGRSGGAPVADADIVATVQAAALRGRPLDPSIIEDRLNSYGNPGADALAAIVKEQGWDAPSPSVDEETFRRLVDNPELTLVWRGGPVGLERGMIEGTPYIGGGVAGPGTYVSTSVRRAGMFAQGSLVPMLIPRDQIEGAPAGRMSHVYDPIRDHALRGQGIVASENQRADWIVYNTGMVIVGPPLTAQFGDVDVRGPFAPHLAPTLESYGVSKAVEWWALVDGVAVPLEVRDDRLIEPVAKHGSPGRPGYAALHPSSKGGKDMPPAAARLAAGKPVIVAPKDVASVVGAFEGADGVVDLTNLHVAGLGLFGGDGLGIAREDMPQIPKTHRDKFFDEQRARGVSVTVERVDPLSMKPTQREMDAVNVAGMVKGMRDGSFVEGSHTLIASSDGYILDGHHRWAAASVRRLETGSGDMGIARVNLPIRQLLEQAQAFNEREGIASRALGDHRRAVAKAACDRAEARAVLKHLQGKHDQRDHGRKGGGSKPPLDKPIGMRDSDHPDEEIIVIPARANPMDGLNVVTIHKGDVQAGVMRYDPYSGKVEWIHVEEQFRRQGVATRLWETGKQVAAEHPNMVEPKHSKSQTTEGAAWAAVVKFAPGLVPVLKHGSHNQKDHGRRISGSVDPAVAAKAIRLVGENGGLSIKMTDGSEPPDGYMVARNSSKFGIAVTADEFYGPRGAEHIAEMVLKNREVLGSGRAYLGIWHQTAIQHEDGTSTPLARADQVVHLDVTDRIVERSRAVSLGRRRDQISIWDVVNFEEIPTGGKGADVAKHDRRGNPEAPVGDDGRRGPGVGEAGPRATGGAGLDRPVLKHGDPSRPGYAAQHPSGGKGSPEALDGPAENQWVMDAVWWHGASTPGITTLSARSVPSRYPNMGRSYAIVANNFATSSYEDAARYAQESADMDQGRGVEGARPVVYQVRPTSLYAEPDPNGASGGWGAAFESMDEAREYWDAGGSVALAFSDDMRVVQEINPADHAFGSEPVAKHGSPGRPGYAALHPDSKGGTAVLDHPALRMPDGWRKRTREEQVAEHVAQISEGWGAGLDPKMVRAGAEALAADTDVYEGPNGSTIAVATRDNVPEAALAPQMETLSQLQAVAPVPGLPVVVSTGPFEAHGIPASTKGFVITGEDRIYLRPSAVTEGVNVHSGNLMPVFGSQAHRYALVHEYGHVLDRRDAVTASTDKANVITKHQTGMSRYAFEDEELGAIGREAFAEAWTGWFGTSGRSQAPFVRYFADTYGWDAGGDGRPPSAGFAKAAPQQRILLGDTFTEEGPIMRALPAVAVIKFAPGLKPVLKHGDPSRPGYAQLHPNGAHGAGGSGQFAAWGKRDVAIMGADNRGPSREDMEAAAAIEFEPDPDEMLEYVENVYDYEITVAVEGEVRSAVFDYWHEHGKDPEDFEIDEMRNEARDRVIDEIASTYRRDIVAGMERGGYRDTSSFDADGDLYSQFGDIYDVSHPVLIGGRATEMGSTVHSVERLSENDSETGYPGIRVMGEISDLDTGQTVGEFTRDITFQPDGEMRVEHALLRIYEPEYQGRGFAKVFNGEAENFYIARGVQRVDVHSALEGGGYAWARQGYDFKHPGSVPYRLENYLSQAAGRLPAKVEGDLRSIQRRFSLLPSDPDYPTPMEVANVGRIAGAPTWPGKDIMRGSDWYGVKLMQPEGTRVSVTEQDIADRDAPPRQIDGQVELF